MSSVCRTRKCAGIHTVQYRVLTPLGWFLVNEQRDAQFFIMYLFLCLTLCMFRAHRAYHQERQIVSIQPLAIVTLLTVGHRRRVTVTRVFIDTICLP